MRRSKAKKKIILPDPKFNEILVTKFVNNIMLQGKKNVAFNIFYDAVEIVEKKTTENGIEIWKKALENVTVLSVKNNTSNEYVYPSQENLANRKYPLARVLYIINCQGYDGLGIGFASFMAGETGQRIILKSGLAPLREPSRNIRIRNKIENN